MHPPDEARAVEPAGDVCAEQRLRVGRGAAPHVRGAGVAKRESEHRLLQRRPGGQRGRDGGLVLSRSYRPRTAGGRAGRPRPARFARSSVVPGQSSHWSEPSGAFTRAPTARTICSTPKPLGSGGCQPSAVWRRVHACRGRRAARACDHAVVELELRDRLVGAGAGGDPAGGDRLGVGVADDGRPFCLQVQVRRAPGRRSAGSPVWPTPKVVPTRWFIQPLPTAHITWLRAQKRRRDVGAAALDAWAAPAPDSQHSAAALAQIPRLSPRTFLDIERCLRAIS